MKERLNEIMNIAQVNRACPKGLAPMIFFFIEDKIAGISPALFENEDEKHRMLTIAGITSKANGATSVAFVCDAAMRKHENAETWKYVNENLATEAPLTYPQGHPSRTECIILLYHDFRTGKSAQLVQEYVESDPIAWGIRRENYGENGDRVEGGLLEDIKYGYTHAEEIMEQTVKAMEQIVNDPLDTTIDPEDHFPSKE